MARPQAKREVVLDDANIRVTRWSFAPGAETGWHRHEHDYVVTPVTPCSFLLEEPGGATRRVEIAKGAPYGRGEGVEHNVINGGTEPMAFIEVELKN